MMSFETCPRCAHDKSVDFDYMNPMVLSGDDREMQCDMCNGSFLSVQDELLLELARDQRWAMYDGY